MNSANKSKYDLFRKRHYVSIIKQTVAYCTWLFGYEKKPFLFESVNKKGEMMLISRGNKNRYAIFYDYMQFKRMFGHLDFEGQAAYTMFLIAHEMRHYYQMRQLDAYNPIEDVKTLEEWRENDQNPKYPGEDCSIFEFYMQPMELDAELFAYVLVASKLDVLVSVDFIDENLLKEMEKHYVRLFGETNNELFSMCQSRGPYSLER